MTAVVAWPAEAAAVAAAFSAGHLVVYPTETVYGLGTSLASGEAGVERVRAAKGSPPGRPYLVLVSSVEAALALWSGDVASHLALLQRAWPGPVTFVAPAAVGLPRSLLGSADGVPTLSVRVPGHEPLRAMLAALGEPVLSTSANRAGEPPPARFEDVDLARMQPDLAADGGPCAGGSPSTLISLAGAAPRVLRPGPVALEDLL